MRAHAGADPPRRGQRRQGALRGSRQVAARGQRGDRVPDVEHARRRHQRRHRLQGAAGRLHAAGGRARPARPTTTSTRGSSASRRTSSPASGSASISRKTIVANGYAAELAVPIWAAFMKMATKGDKPDWFTRPTTSSRVNVCRAVGQAAERGLRRRRRRSTTTATSRRKSMIYTDYFVKGTQPTTMCPLHPGGVIATAGDHARRRRRSRRSARPRCRRRRRPRWRDSRLQPVQPGADADPTKPKKKELLEAHLRWWKAEGRRSGAGGRA